MPIIPHLALLKYEESPAHGSDVKRVIIADLILPHNYREQWRSPLASTNSNHLSKTPSKKKTPSRSPLRPKDVFVQFRQDSLAGDGIVSARSARMGRL
jgi:hypothetical protein